jgi:GNAT superfamily N-acetyltransferase
MRELVLTAEEFGYLSEAVVKAGGCLRFEAHGFSMYPFLKHNDIITVRPANDSELVPGAVVLCRTSPHRLAVHRIAGSLQVGGTDGDLLLIRGDACPGGGEFIGKDDVLGIISHVERGPKQFRVDRGSRLLLGRILALDNNLLLWGRSCLNFLRRIAARLLRYVQSWGMYRNLLNRSVANSIIYNVQKRESPAKKKPRFSTEPFSQVIAAEVFVKGLCQTFRESYIISAALWKRQIGFVELTNSGRSQNGADWWLVDLRVWPLLRGAGIGEQLVRRAITMAQDKGIALLNVLVKKDNKPALALYEKLGFLPSPSALRSSTMEMPGDNEFERMSLALE